MKRLMISTSVLALMLGGCASQQDILGQFSSGSCTFKNGQTAPDWVCAGFDEFPRGYWYAEGTADASIVDANMQKTVAMQNARIALAQRASTQVFNEFNQMIEVTGYGDDLQNESITKDISRLTTDIELPPTAKVRQLYDSDGNLHMLVRVEEAAILRQVEERKRQLSREFNARLKANASPLQRD